jgi:hypothetical protein
MPRFWGVAKVSVTLDLVSPSQGCEKGPKYSPHMCLFSTWLHEWAFTRLLADKIALKRASPGSFNGQAFRGKKVQSLSGLCTLHSGNFDTTVFQYVEKFQVFVKLGKIDIFTRKLMSVEINVVEYY